MGNKKDEIDGAYDKTMAVSPIEEDINDSSVAKESANTVPLNFSDSHINHDISADNLKKGTIVDGYKIEGLLGKGGMGTVYKAWDIKLKRNIALKLLIGGSPVAVDRFRMEAVAVARIENKGVATVHQTGMYRGHYYIAMELVDGDVFDKYLKKK
jgi:serine/threonine protein kinase